MKKMKKGLFVILLMAFGWILAVQDAAALPHFSRKVAKDCTFCHSVFPKLNETGRIFRSNGYRFAEDMEKWAVEVKDWTSFPMSAEVEIEGVYNNDTKAGVKTKESDMKIDEIELMFGGAMGKTGKITAISMISIQQGAPTATDDDEYDLMVHKAFVQINDLIGADGGGLLNIRAGQWAIALPFIGPDQKVVMNRYLAEKTLGVFSEAQRAVELNGSIVAPEETNIPTHRYSLGLSREDVADKDKLQGYYLTYAMTIRENYNLGVIYRHTKKDISGGTGGADADFDKFGVAAEASIDRIKLSLGYFISDGKDGQSDMKNYMAEALYMPINKVTLGGRYDVVKKDDVSDKAKAATLSLRYNILSNVFTQIEYRHLNDNGRVVGSNEKESRGRLVLVALF